MRSSKFFIFILFSAVLCAGVVSAAEISAEKIECSLGEEKTIEIWLSGASSGLAGYIMTPVLHGDIMADVLFTPSEEFILSDIDDESRTASALDLYDAMRPGSDPLLLGTLQISPIVAGEGELYFDITEMTDDMGEPIEVIQNGIIILATGEAKSSTMVGLETGP